MSRFGALLLLTMLSSPSWAASDTPTRPEEQPVEVPSVKPPEDLPPPVSPGEAISIDPPKDSGGTVPEISTPPDAVWMPGMDENGEMTPIRASGNLHNTPEPSTLLLAGLGVTLLGVRACRKRRQTAEE